MIDLTKNQDVIEIAKKRCNEKDIIIPTFEQMKHPERIPETVIDELTEIGLWDIHPRNLFRITWKNDPIEFGGGFGDVNYMFMPPEITGVKARIFGLVGKWFPTGAHKVGATFGCLAPSLVTGQFNPVSQHAVWPSTGNYCRGGAYVAALLGCESIAILPEEMSRERFEWLSRVAGEVIATPGCESNVKEIFDKCHELRETRDDIVIFNQFSEFGNMLWHYEVTGSAMKEILQDEMMVGDRLAGVVLTSGSSGTMGSAYHMKKLHPRSKVAVSEALQCPTLLLNGYGGHRIEGIGDKHVPWIHDLKETDTVIAIDDEITIRLMRLFNEPAGRDYLMSQNIPEEFIRELDLLGISSIANLISSIKFAKFYELDERDIVLTVFTDSMELYSSRMAELANERGKYTRDNAIADFDILKNIGMEHVIDTTYYERKRIHNLKYFTWIEQQNMSLDELNAQWYDHDAYWNQVDELPEKIDNLINEFNKEVGLL
ncbi:MAG: pyridoxal-phosphate dependent enzyme [Candidatus Zixiibacteriota bacterium]